MEQSEINAAVKSCVREAIGAADPLEALLTCIDKLRSEGRSEAELEIIRTTCIQMLSVIYDVRSIEVDEQPDN
jgi:hypothetical protein